MKFFKCHSQKMKDDKVICVQDKFTDIGPDVFDGFSVEYIILSDRTQIIRNYAFSGIGKCCIYLPKAISEIEPLAFENMNCNTTFYCVKGSYAEQRCIEHGLIVNYDIDEIYRLVDEQKRLVEEQKKLVEDQKRLVEEQKRLVEEQKRILEEQQLKKQQNVAEAEDEIEEHKLEECKTDENAKCECMLDLISALKQVEAYKKNELKKRRITVYVFDDVNGEKSDVVSFDDLSEEEKPQVIDEEIYIHKTTVNGQEKSSVVSKSEYEELKKQLQVDEENVEIKSLCTCMFCKEEILESDLFCPFCGRKVKNIKFCGHCGEASDEDDNFCAVCGAKL